MIAKHYASTWKLALCLAGLTCLPLTGTNEAGLPHGFRPPSADRYLAKYRYLAVTTHQRTGIPLSIILAVAGLESEWGNSEIAKAGNNHFGIKDTDWLGPVYCKPTTEYFPSTGQILTRACFRKYKLIADSYHDFGHFISTRKYYRHCFQFPAWDYRGWAYGLQYGGYATDPNYAAKLINLIERYRLYEI